MAGRGPQSFKKRQKEQQRKEKQEAKLAKKLERRQTGTGSSLDVRPGNVPGKSDRLSGQARIRARHSFLIRAILIPRPRSARYPATSADSPTPPPAHRETSYCRTGTPRRQRRLRSPPVLWRDRGSRDRPSLRPETPIRRPRRSRSCVRGPAAGRPLLPPVRPPLEAHRKRRDSVPDSTGS